MLSDWKVSEQWTQGLEPSCFFAEAAQGCRFAQAKAGGSEKNPPVQRSRTKFQTAVIRLQLVKWRQDRSQQYPDKGASRDAASFCEGRECQFSVWLPRPVGGPQQFGHWAFTSALPAPSPIR